MLSLSSMFVIRFFFRSGSRCPLCENGLRKVLIKSVILRRVLQRYGESSDRQSCFYQQCSYGRGRRGQLAEGQAVIPLKKKFHEKLSTALHCILQHHGSTFLEIETTIWFTRRVAHCILFDSEVLSAGPTHTTPPLRDLSR